MWLFGLAGFIVLVALFLRLAPISNESVDGDEMFSHRVATSQRSQALNLVRQDLVHPPLYYLLLKATLPADGAVSALDLRLLSLIAAAACIAVVILIGFVSLPLRRPAFLAAFLLAWNRTHIFYSQEARSYALFCFLAGTLLLWSFLMDRYEHARSYWLAGSVLMAALLYTHYFGGFYCAAVVLPVVLASRPKRVKIRALAALVVAAAAFLPWVWQLIAVYRDKSGLASNLGWLGPPALFDLKLVYADYLGIPNFRGATSVVFLLGAALFVIAMLPDSRRDRQVLDRRARIALALWAVMPPLFDFFLSRWPFQLPIFGARHVLPSILAALLLVSYGLWRLASLTSKRLRVPVLVIGSIVLFVLQALPVWSQWPTPSRVPYAAIAARLRRAGFDSPVYTTWTYGIGGPVLFYLDHTRRIDELPADAAALPDRCVVLYRPTVAREDAAVRPLLDRFRIREETYYQGRDRAWGTRLLVLEKRTGWARTVPAGGAKAVTAILHVAVQPESGPAYGKRY